MQVRCKSGLMGERGYLQDRYQDFAEFKAYCRTFGLHRRLGYRSMKAAWEDNPIVESSTDPTDFRKVTAKELAFFHYVRLSKADCDVVIVFPGGKELTIQARPSNADVNYNGSLDIILPDNQPVTNWRGDDMQAAPPVHDGTDADGYPNGVKDQDHIRMAKQLVTELPGNYS